MPLISLGEIKILTLFLVVLFRYVFLASVAFSLFYVVRRESWRFKKIQQKFPVGKDYRREILYSLSTSVIFTFVGWLVFMTPVKEYTRAYFTIRQHGVGYFVFSIVLILVVHDAYFYWTHRGMHHPAVFKWFHRVHHLSVNPSPWAAMAFHPLEAIVEAGIIIVWYFFSLFIRWPLLCF